MTKGFTITERINLPLDEYSWFKAIIVTSAFCPEKPDVRFADAPPHARWCYGAAANPIFFGLRLLVGQWSVDRNDVWWTFLSATVAVY